MTDGGELVSHFSGISMRSKLGEHLASEWKCVISPSVVNHNSSLCHCHYQILGFSTSGAPVLPEPIGGHDADTVQRFDKLGWEDIAVRSAKIVSFSGMYA